MRPQSYPPIYLPQPPTPITTATAHTLLSTYLTTSLTSAHLHPNALLTESSVDFSTQGGPEGGIILHSLRRVEAGLRGEYLEPEVLDPIDAALAEDDLGMVAQGAAYEGKYGKGVRVIDGGEEGQDPEEYAREQEGDGILEGELGARSNYLGQEGDGDGVVEEVRTGAGAVDKEARKRAKKEKRKLEKKEQEQKKRQKL